MLAETCGGMYVCIAYMYVQPVYTVLCSICMYTLCTVYIVYVYIYCTYVYNVAAQPSWCGKLSSHLKHLVYMSFGPVVPFLGNCHRNVITHLHTVVYIQGGSLQLCLLG